MKRRSFLKIVGGLPFIFKRKKYRRSIGLQDRQYNMIHEGDTFRVKTSHGERTGIIRWAKYAAGYTLQNGKMTIATFRLGSDVGVPPRMRELPDGRIDGIIIKV